MPLNQLLSAGMIVEALVFGAIAAVIYQKKKKKLARCQKTFGEVIEVKERNAGDGCPTKHPVVRYRSPVTGELMTYESRFGKSNWNIKVGDNIAIVVDPHNPSDAEIVGFLSLWIIPTALGIFAIASLIGAVVVYFVMK